MEYFFLIFAIALLVGFEFVNGFHDTANAVATVIYTNTLKPTYAVIWSGICNLLGVLASSGTVAFAIISLLPIDLLINGSATQSLLMVLSILISAIIWNLGTWYVGLPVSSTHSLIGSITGIAIAHSLWSTHQSWWHEINWPAMKEVLISLVISPLLGFGGALLLFVMAKAIFRQPELYSPPDENVPSRGVRALLILTCTGVSFAHGSNDGQKGIGLMMLILIGFLPSLFALNLDTSPQAIAQIFATSHLVTPALETQINRNSPDQLTLPPTLTNQLEQASQDLTNFLQPQGQLTANTWQSLLTESLVINEYLKKIQNFTDISASERRHLRNDIYLVSSTITKLEKQKQLANFQDPKLLISYRNQLEQIIKFIPFWVKLTIALALGLGTMIGWKRVVITVGEKIGTEHLNYAQGATAELVTMTTIGAANYWGLPVSTTHILSSGIAGTMLANQAGLQIDTLKNLLLAWIFTLPSCILLGFITFAIAIFMIEHQIFGLS